MTTTSTTPILPFPLAWPSSSPRTARADRRRSHFGADHAGDVSPAAARAFLLDELARLGATSVMVTSNLPMSRQDVAAAPPDFIGDPGVAAWFELRGERRVLGCDRWVTVAENLRALALTVEAMRGLERWGAAEVVERAMSGFAALPAGGATDAAITTSAPTSPRTVTPAGGAPIDWRKVLRAEPGENLATVKRRYRNLMSVVHPDQGGRNALASRLNDAMSAAERDLASGGVA
jgi:DnaJ-domain-containing protein 1